MFVGNLPGFEHASAKPNMQEHWLPSAWKIGGLRFGHKWCDDGACCKDILAASPVQQ